MANDKEKFQHKLGVSRGTERSRIWMEGERLINAGFRRGIPFRKTWTETTLTLTIEARGADGKRADFGTVAGTADRPVIDIVGERVRETFGNGTHINVTYERDCITIRRVN